MEELKLVLETIKTISGDASTVAIWWVVLHYMIGFLKILCVCVAGFFTIYYISKFCAQTSEWARAGKEVARAYGGDGYSDMYNKDTLAIAKAIELANK